MTRTTVELWIASSRDEKRDVGTDVELRFHRATRLESHVLAIDVEASFVVVFVVDAIKHR